MNCADRSCLALLRLLFLAFLVLCRAGCLEADDLHEVVFLQSGKHLVAELAAGQGELRDELIDPVGADPRSDLVENLDLLLKRLEERKAFALADVDTAGEYGPSFAERAAAFAEADAEILANGSFILFNPSLVKLPAGWGEPHERWLAVFRHQTSITFPRYSLFGSQSNSVVLAVLDSDWQRTRPFKVLQSEDFFKEAFDCVQEGEDRAIFGPEDARLYMKDERDSEVMLLFNANFHYAHTGVRCGSHEHRMFIASLDSSLQPVWTRPILTVGEEVTDKASSKASGVVLSEVIGDSDPSVFSVNQMSEAEKNWSPFTVPGGSNQESSTALIYSVDPHVILHLEVNGTDARVGRVWNTSSREVALWRERRYAESNDTVYNGFLHGGVSPVLVPAREGRPALFLSVLHLKTNADGRLGHLVLYDYTSYIYAFEAQPPFKVLGVAEKSLPLQQGMTRMEGPLPLGISSAFPTQLLWLDADGGDSELAVIYGSGDIESRRLVLTLTQLQEFLPTEIRL
eukprot:gb/GFBE01007066.1/.p1 GENE.gb/GFBE01007066.1/~~gb/GFBE01007066.1/.p1  ORF type:complete len:514 (+),score=79.62 gb/GFBE01007066.1/:1-1542(+)